MVLHGRSCFFAFFSSPETVKNLCTEHDIPIMNSLSSMKLATLQPGTPPLHSGHQQQIQTLQLTHSLGTASSGYLQFVLCYVCGRERSAPELLLYKDLSPVFVRAEAGSGTKKSFSRAWVLPPLTQEPGAYPAHRDRPGPHSRPLRGPHILYMAPTLY